MSLLIHIFYTGKNGAAPDSWFSHLAIEVPGENTGNEWREAVDSAQYEKMQ